MIKIGILGYGNLGRGVLGALKQNDDMTPVAVFTRRNPSDICLDDKSIPVVSVSDMANWKDKIDIMILCGGSATDLPVQGPEVAKLFNIIDSFDTHAKIPEYFSKVNDSLLESKKIGIISVGWDPGMFSINRLYMNSILPQGKDYTFWGEGVSQGHSDAIRRVQGVVKGIQYTIPVEKVLKEVREGKGRDYTTREKHIRVCYVVPAEGADLKKIESEIKNMPNYFSDYDTTVNFISDEEFVKNHSAIPHGGNVIRVGKTANATHTIEFSLKLESNPEFTSSVLVAYARAAYRLYSKGETGCRTVFDIAPVLLHPSKPEDLIKNML